MLVEDIDKANFLWLNFIMLLFVSLNRLPATEGAKIFTGRMEELSKPLSSEPSTHLRHLLERVETQRRNDHLCDVAVLVRGKYFKAHKVVLTASSPFFRKLLTSGMRESNEDVIKIELDEATEDVMEDVLSYIYTGDVSITCLLYTSPSPRDA